MMRTLRDVRDARESTARVAALVDRYSIAVTTLIDDAVGSGSAGNPQVQVLAELSRVPRLRPRDLVELTGLSRAGVAALVTRLERIGIVERVHGEHDRRTMFASLTPEGRRRVRDLDVSLEAFFLESRPLVEEIVDVLGGVESARGPRDESEKALTIAGRLASAGAPYARQLESELGAMSVKSRLALTTLLVDGPLRPGQLASVLELTSGGLTYLVDHLEADDLVERSHGLVADDRRAVVIRLTDRGEGVVTRICSILDDHAASIRDSLERTLHAPPAG